MTGYCVKGTKAKKVRAEIGRQSALLKLHSIMCKLFLSDSVSAMHKCNKNSPELPSHPVPPVTHQSPTGVDNLFFSALCVPKARVPSVT